MFVQHRTVLSHSAPILLCIVALISGHFSGLAKAQAPFQVLDINKTPMPWNSSPGPAASGSNNFLGSSRFARVGPWAFFPATGALTGTELYKTLGTATSGTLVKDIRSGLSGSGPHELTVVGTRIFFTAIDDKHGYELWVTDGTAKGTQMVVDLYAGVASSFPKNLCALGKTGKIIFQASTSKTGGELYISDGTAKGTRLLKDIYSGPGQSNPRFLRSFHNGQKDLVLFQANSVAQGYELWVTDGSSAGTRLLKDIVQGTWGSEPKYFQVLGRKVIFAAASAFTGVELWVTDGTTKGTTLLMDIYAGKESGTALYSGLNLGGKYYFEGTTSTTGTEVWVTDGTSKGTVLVSDTLPGPASGGFKYGTALGTNIIYRGNGTASGLEAWILDTIAGKATLLKDIQQGPRSSSPLNFVTMGKKVFFLAETLTLGRELYESDGTPTGTKLLKDIDPGKANSYCRNLSPLLARRLIFTANSGGYSGLWATDGTEKGTVKIPVAANQTPTSSSYPTDAEPFRGELWFGADDGVHGSEMWASDGTAKGTRLVVDLFPGRDASGKANASYPRYMTRLGNKLLFSADDGKGKGRELWISDGTANGARLLKDIFDGPTSSSPAYLGRVGSKVYFAAQGYDNAKPRNYVGQELFVTDGTTAGTKLLANLTPGIVSSLPRGFTEIGSSGKFVFTAYAHSPINPRDPIGQELWISDGTTAGTRILMDIMPGKGSGNPSDFVRMGGKVYFSATGPFTGRELWVTDGTVAGTQIVKDIGQSPASSSNPRFLAVQGGKLYFQAYLFALGRELFVSDGTKKGTKLFKELVTGSISGTPSYVTAVGSRHLWFSGYAKFPKIDFGYELWKSDLTATGTRLHANLAPGVRSSYPSGFYKNGRNQYVVVNGKVFFTALSQTTGYELWLVDNGATATRMGQACQSSRLQSTDPVLGGKATITGSTRSGFAANVLLLGIGPARSVPLGGGCQLYLDLAGPLLILNVSTGSKYGASLPIPNSAGLLGYQMRLQSFHLGPRFPAASGFSNGLDWTLGR